MLCPHGTTTLPLYTAPPEPVNQQLLAALKACDEAMSYMSEYDIPITLPDMVRSAIAAAEAAQMGEQLEQLEKVHEQTVQP